MFLNFCRFPVFYLFFLMTAVGLRSAAPAAIGGPSGESRINEPPGPAAPVPKIPGLDGQPSVRSVKWDYFENPVKSSSPSSKPEDFVFGTIPLFDGYPARVSQPSIRIYWNGEAPQPGKPVHVDIDYFQPVAVTRFVHYFGRVPRMIPDGANTEINWHGWRDTEVFTAAMARIGTCWGTLSWRGISRR